MSLENNSGHFEVVTPLSDAAVAKGWDVYSHYAKTADPDSQYIVAIEECGELVQAITKLKRVSQDPGKSALARERLAEEMADMRIMLAQLSAIMGNDEAVAEQTSRKLQRQRERITGTVGAVSGF